MESKTIIWRDTNIRNTENTGYFNNIRKWFSKNLNIYAVDDNQSAFEIIEKNSKKELIFMISNRGNDGLSFLLECREKKNIINQSLIFCGTTNGWENHPKISITTSPVALYQFINDAVLGWAPDQYLKEESD